MNSLRIAALLVLCACFAAAQTPATPQTPATSQTATASQQSQPEIKNPKLEFANANSAKIAWTSSSGSQMGMHYGTDKNNLTQPVGSVDQMNGDNHRVTLANLQPNTTYYVQLWTINPTQPVGGIYTFKTPAQGQQPIHEQPLNPAQ